MTGNSSAEHVGPSNPKVAKPAVRSKLIALDEDVKTLREVERAAAPWFDVVLTRQPKQAIALAEADQSVAVLVTEQVLSTTTGVTVLEAVRAVRPDVKRVLLTGYGDLAAIVVGLHSGAVEKIVYKPFGAAELTTAICPPRSAASRATA